MSRLLLLRHAKARWAEPGERDFDRPLDAQGLSDARRLGDVLRAGDRLPCRIAVSAARRTRQTAEELRLDDVPIVAIETLYEASARAALDLIREMEPQGDLMVVGHNPVMEDLAAALVRNGGASRRLGAGFPTCGLAVIAFSTSLDRIGLGTGELEAFMIPPGFH